MDLPFAPPPLKVPEFRFLKSGSLRSGSAFGSTRELGARLTGRTATQRSKKGSENVLGRVLGEGSQKGSEKGACYGFYSEERVLRRVLRRGSEKGVNPEGA